MAHISKSAEAAPFYLRPAKSKKISAIDLNRAKLEVDERYAIMDGQQRLHGIRIQIDSGDRQEGTLDAE